MVMYHVSLPVRWMVIATWVVSVWWWNNLIQLIISIFCRIKGMIPLRLDLIWSINSDVTKLILYVFCLILIYKPQFWETQRFNIGRAFEVLVQIKIQLFKYTLTLMTYSFLFLNTLPALTICHQLQTSIFLIRIMVILYLDTISVVTFLLTMVMPFMGFS